MTQYRKTRAPFIAVILLLPVMATEAFAQQNEDEQAEESKAEDVEYIEVIGQYIGIEVPETFGRFTLDEDFIRNAPKTTGDINDIVALLPGVQLSEDALAVSAAGEIRAKPLSISGAQPWQTGFFINGMNYNSRIDPDAYSRSESSVNDVQGGPQSFNVNSQIVESIDVYDSNIPVDFGGFSGGVVDVKTRNVAGLSEPHFSLGYRASRSDWNEYHIIESDGSDENPETSSEELTSQLPVFQQDSLNLLAELPIAEDHALVLSGNYLKSTKSKLSLSETWDTERENINLMATYSAKNIWFDTLDFSLMYAPYENRNLLTDALNSEFTVSGGGYGTTLNTKKVFDSGIWRSEISIDFSENSREAPQHYFLWLTARGKEWGQLNNQGASDVSKEGGYGNLDKTQTTARMEQKFQWNDFVTGEVEHRVMMGVTLSRQQLARQRISDSYYYNSPQQYSASAGNNPLNCSGYTLDCVELETSMTIEELEAQLGKSLDFSNPEHVLAYSNIVTQTPQYFSFRLVYPKEDIEVAVNQFSAYINDEINWGRWKFQLGLRYDYDDFFQNHTIAPRLSGSWDWFDDNNTLFIFGLNRYYDAGLVTYKLKEEQEPYYSEFRSILNGSLQAWIPSSQDANLRYRYDDVDSPYNDEITVALKQSLGVFGYLSIRGVYRWQKDQLARAEESVLGEDGYRYAYQDNSGYGTSQRVSIAWSGSWDRHSFWANTDFSKTKSSNDSYNEVVEDVSLDEIVLYYNDGVASLTTVSAIATINTNFSRPLRVNFGWHGQWTEQFSTTLNGNYTQGYDTAVNTGRYETSGRIAWLCSDCGVDSFLVPVYSKVSVASRWQLNLAARYRLETMNFGDLSLSVDATNLLNARTYLIAPGAGGVETGRTLWAGVEWDW